MPIGCQQVCSCAEKRRPLLSQVSGVNFDQCPRRSLARPTARRSLPVLHLSILADWLSIGCACKRTGRSKVVCLPFCQAATARRRASVECTCEKIEMLDSNTLPDHFRWRHEPAILDPSDMIPGGKMPLSRKCRASLQMAVGQNQWYHFGIGARPI